MTNQQAPQQSTNKPKLHTLQSLIDGLAAHGDRPAMLALHKEDSEHWSYARLADHVQRLAQGLAKAGVDQGDLVALFADNQPEWIMACLAVIRAGAVSVPLDAQLGDEVLAHILSDSRPRFIFTTKAKAERLERLELDAKPRPILFDAGADDEHGWQRWLTDKAGEPPKVEPDDPATLFYTSGTTGPPKGVPLSHGNLAFQLNTLIEADLVSGDDRLLLPLPLHHVYPFVVGMLAPLALGLPIVLPQSLTGPQLIRALGEGRVTLIIGVPRLYSALYSGLEARAQGSGRIAATLFTASVGLSTWLRRRLGLRLGKRLLAPLHKQFGPQLRVLASGGSPLDPELAWKLEGLGWQLAMGYGLTETSPLLTINPPGKARMDSVGRPIPGVEIRIDPSAKPEESAKSEGDKSNEQGEILARGPNVFKGYHNLPEKTAKAFTEDGWFRTGDLGYLDADGYLHVVGRVSTLIVMAGGENIQPDDVEEAYQSNPVIAEAGVLQKNGQLVAVIVPQLREIRQQNDGEIEPAVRKVVKEQARRLPSYQRLADYVISRNPLPRTRLGKIRRHKLEERYEQVKAGAEETDKGAKGAMPLKEMAGEDRALLENPEPKQVWELLARRYPDRRLTPDTSPQLDLGIDSLEWLNLTLEIRSRVNVELSEEAIDRIDTVRDLLREVAKQAEAGESVAKVPPLEAPEEALSEDQKRWLQPLGPVQKAVAGVLFVVNRILMRGLFRLQVKGLEHLPAQGPFILAPNHVSYLDPLVIGAALDYRRLRQTYWGGWTGVVFGNPLTRLFSRLVQVVPIDPRRAVLSSLAFGGAVLKRGHNLIWFPEGQRSPSGELQPFRPGIGMLLDHYQVPVVPVFIQGSHAALPRGKTLPRFSRITVAFGKPLQPQELKQQGEGDQPQQRIANALHKRVAALQQRLADAPN